MIRQKHASYFLQHPTENDVWSPEMASTYERKDSDYIWISYKTASGKWRNKNSEYLKSNAGAKRQAERVANNLTRQERIARAVHRKGTWTWVDGWIETTWGSPQKRTPRQYCLYWRTLQRWLSEDGLKGPAFVHREQCLNYPKWRQEHNGSRNTAILELKFLGQVMEGAVRRGYCERNT